MKRSEVLSLLLCNNFEKEFKKFSDKFIIKINNKKFPNEIFWFIDNECFLNYEFKTNDLWCRCGNFCKFFCEKFDFNYEEIKYLIKYEVEKHFNLKEVTPCLLSKRKPSLVEEHFKL